MLHKNDAISIIMTFVFGFIIGVFVFFSGYGDKEQIADIPSIDEQPSFVLEGEAYGGCQMSENCPSFHIESDGTYRFLYTPTFGEEQTIKEGSLPRSLRTEINVTFTDEALVAQSRKIQPTMCNAYVDGIDVRYKIVIGEQAYLLDSCGTDVNVDSPLWQTLVKIWNYFETGEV